MSDFKSIQKQLANAIKDPDKSHNFDQRRIGIYQELIFNNIEGFCSTAFPVLKSILDEADWHSLVRGYLIEYSNHSPYFVDIAEQFLAYLTSLPIPQKQPWRNELAHYEWVELYISLQESPKATAPNTCLDDLMDANIQVVDSAWALAYQFPVHKISVANAHEFTAQPTFLIVYLDPKAEVKFLQTSALTIHALNVIEQHEQIKVSELESVLTKAPFELNQLQAAEFIKDAVSDLSEKGIISLS